MNLQIIKDTICSILPYLYKGNWDECHIRGFKYNNRLKCWIVVYELIGTIGSIPYGLRREKKFSWKRLEEFVKYCEL